MPLIEGVTIEAVAAEGKCLFHWDDMVVFVPWCVPGDVCDVQIRRKKHSFSEGEVVRFVQYSKQRATPFCQHFGVCGGCKWQNLPYEEQLKAKQQQVLDQLTRIGKIEMPPISPIIGSVQTREYRNKLDFGCANKRYITNEEMRADPNPEAHQSLKDQPAIGFHITGAFDKILPIEKCWLMHPLHNEIRNAIRDYALQHGISFFDLRQQKGLLRDIIIRNSNSGEWMVVVQFHYDETGGETEALDLMQFVADTFPQITSLMYVDNQKCNDTIGDQQIITFRGTDHIFELMADLRFKVGPKSFYQTNTEQALHLYEVALRFNGVPMIPENVTYNYLFWYIYGEGGFSFDDMKIYESGAEPEEAFEYGSSGGADPGDADGDGKITSTDARLALQIAVNKIDRSSVSKPAALDVDGDGGVTSTDARLILQFSVGKIDAFPAA